MNQYADNLDDDNAEAMQPMQEGYKAKMAALEEMADQQDALAKQKLELSKMGAMGQAAGGIAAAFNRPVQTYSHIVTGTKPADYSQDIQKGFQQNTEMGQELLSQKYQDLISQYKAKNDAAQTLANYKAGLAKEMRGYQSQASLEGMKQRGQKELEAMKLGAERSKQTEGKPLSIDEIGKFSQNDEAIADLEKLKGLLKKKEYSKEYGSAGQKVQSLVSKLPLGLGDIAENAMQSSEEKELDAATSQAMASYIASVNKTGRPSSELMPLYKNQFPSLLKNSPQEAENKIDALIADLKSKKESSSKALKFQGYKVPESQEQSFVDQKKQTDVTPDIISKYKAKYPNASEEQIINALKKRGINNYAAK